MNPIIASVASLFIRLVLGSDVFTRIQNQVFEWSSKKISGAEKREGILDSLEVIGLKGAEWMLRAAIELAIGKLVGYNAKLQPTADDFAKAINKTAP